MEGNVLLQNDSTKGKHVNREHNGTENRAMWDSAGETSLRTGKTAYAEGETTVEMVCEADHGGATNTNPTLETVLSNVVIQCTEH